MKSKWVKAALLGILLLIAVSAYFLNPSYSKYKSELQASCKQWMNDSEVDKLIKDLKSLVKQLPVIQNEYMQASDAGASEDQLDKIAQKYADTVVGIQHTGIAIGTKLLSEREQAENLLAQMMQTEQEQYKLDEDELAKITQSLEAYLHRVDAQVHQAANEILVEINAARKTIATISKKAGPLNNKTKDQEVVDKELATAARATLKNYFAARAVVKKEFTKLSVNFKQADMSTLIAKFNATYNELIKTKNNYISLNLPSADPGALTAFEQYFHVFGRMVQITTVLNNKLQEMTKAAQEAFSHLEKELYQRDHDLQTYMNSTVDLSELMHQFQLAEHELLPVQYIAEQETSLHRLLGEEITHEVEERDLRKAIQAVLKKEIAVEQEDAT